MIASGAMHAIGARAVADKSARSRVAGTAKGTMMAWWRAPVQKPLATRIEKPMVLMSTCALYENN
jgi:hypothetical protein